MLHIKNLCFLAGLLAITSLAISPAHAQKNEPPSGQFGIGVYSVRYWTPSGLEAVYAINSSAEIGSELSLGVAGGGGGGSTTTFLIAPFARFSFPATVSPFVQGGLQVLVGGGGSNVGLFLGGGVGYNINHTISFNAGIDLLNIFFSPSFTTFGWSVIRADADWFF